MNLLVDRWNHQVYEKVEHWSHDFFSYVVKQSESEKFGLIEMYDVTSGTCFREIRMKVKYGHIELDYLVGFNSKFMVISKFGSRNGQMDVYDLAAVKNPIADRIWLYT